MMYCSKTVMETCTFRVSGYTIGWQDPITIRAPWQEIGSMLPNISNFTSVHSDRLVERHTAQLQHNTKGCSMNELPVGYRDHTKNQFNVGIISERNGRLHAITTESGQNVS